MTKLTIDLPQDVLQKLESRARRPGVTNVSDYAASVLRDDATFSEAVDYGAPESVKVRTASDPERIVQARSDESGDIECDDKFFDDLERYARDADARSRQ